MHAAASTAELRIQDACRLRGGVRGPVTTGLLGDSGDASASAGRAMCEQRVRRTIGRCAAIATPWVGQQAADWSYPGVPKSVVLATSGNTLGTSILTTPPGYPGELWGVAPREPRELRGSSGLQPPQPRISRIGQIGPNGQNPYSSHTRNPKYPKIEKISKIPRGPGVPNWRIIKYRRGCTPGDGSQPSLGEGSQGRCPLDPPTLQNHRFGNPQLGVGIRGSGDLRSLEPPDLGI